MSSQEAVFENVPWDSLSGWLMLYLISVFGLVSFFLPLFVPVLDGVPKVLAYQGGWGLGLLFMMVVTLPVLAKQTEDDADE